MYQHSHSQQKQHHKPGLPMRNQAIFTSSGIPHWPSYPLHTHFLFLLVYWYTCAICIRKTANFFRRIFCKGCFKGGRRADQKIMRAQKYWKRNDTTKDIPGHLSSLVEKVERKSRFWMACSCLGGRNNVNNLKGYILTRSAIVCIVSVPCPT